MSQTSLSPRRQRIYDFIVAFKQDHDGVSPSVAEIGAACGIKSTSTTRYYLDSLMNLGLIVCEYGKGKSRMISVPGGRWVPPQSDGRTAVGGFHQIHDSAQE